MKQAIPIIMLLLTGSLTATAQTKVTSGTFGEMEARHLGPGTMSGRITAIDGVAEDEKTLYIGTAGGGVWKSTNAGTSFRSVFDKYCQSIGAIAVDQTHPATVFVGTGESNMRNTVSVGNGLYKSTDAGGNWTKVGLDSTEHIARIVIDPKRPDNIYVAAPGPLWSDSKHRGLYKSTDGGTTWNKILYINEKTGCADVSVDPSNPDIVYATTWEFRRRPYEFNSGGVGSGVYKSTDGGKTWRELKDGLPNKPFGRVALALAPSAPQNMLAIVEAKETGLYISSDGGEHWKAQSASTNVRAQPFYFSTLVVDPQDPKRVYRPAYQFEYSDDGGYSFSDASSAGGWVHSDHHALWINPKHTNQMYLGTDGGVYMSLDRGASWLFLQNLPVGQFYHVALDEQTPYHMYGGLQDNGSWTAPSAAPGGLGNANWMNIYFGDGFWAVPDLTDPNTAFAESQGGDIGRIDLRTLKSTNVQPQQGPGEEKLRWNWNTPIVTGQSNKHHLYIGAQYLYLTTDQGRRWQRISPDLTTNDKKKQRQEESGGLSEDNTSAENHCTIFTIAESPLDEQLVWVGTDDGNIQRTTDGGKTWTNLSKNYAAAGVPAGTWVSSIEPSRFDKQVVYATFDNHMYGDFRTYLAKSADGGATWQLLSSEAFRGFAHKLKEDLVNRDLLFLGTEMGLFATVDGGASWFLMKNNIPEFALVRDIQIHPVTNDLVLATHGRGIIVVDDISPMRSMTKDIIEQSVFLFPLNPVPGNNGKYGNGGFPSNGGWRAGNPDAVDIPPIRYYLKDRVSSGEVKMEILDAEGKLVQNLPAGKRKGINKVYWNLRMTPPKVATGGTKPDYAGFTAPMVLPGTYTVRLKVGDKEYTHPIQVVHDTANKNFSEEDRKLQYETAMELYRMHEQLAAVVDRINAAQKVIKENDSTIRDARTRKLLVEYNTRLETLRATLLGTKHTSIFADEKELRENISEVYTAVSYQEARPSNLQVSRTKALKEQVQQAEKDYQKLQELYAAKVKSAISDHQADVPMKVNSARGGN